MRKLVSIVIVTQNRADDLDECLCSIINQTLKADEIIVVDNASNDNTVEMVRLKYPLVKLILMPFNTGCPGGRNIGIVNSSGEIIFFLDDDCIIDQDAIEKIVNRFNKEPELGVISMAVVNFYSNSKAVPYFSPQNLGLEERYFYNFSGGASAIKKEVFDKAGLFPQDYLYGGEERDISYRILSEGYRILYFPEVKMHHKISPLMRNIYIRFKSNIYNEITIFLKYYPYNKAFAAILWKLLYVLRYSIKTRSFYYLFPLFESPSHILKKLKIKRYPIDGNILKIEQLLKKSVIKDYRDIEYLMRLKNNA